MFAKFLKVMAFGGMIGLSPVFARAARMGHPGVSTRGATSAQTQFNLISDPVYATSGSTTTSYTDPGTVVQFTSVSSMAPFVVTDVIFQVNDGFVDCPADQQVAGQFDRPVLESGEFETGIVQVFWMLPAGKIPGDANKIPPPTDDNTHMLTFTNVGNLSKPETFLDYMDAGMGHGGTDGVAAGITPSPDSYSGFNPAPFTYSANPDDQNYPSASAGFPTYSFDTDHPNDQFDTQSVTMVAGTPEPASIGLLAAVCAAGLLRRRRARM